MKILHVIPSVSPVRGGPSRAVLEMVASLRSQGVDAEIATTNDDGAGLLDVPLNQLSDYVLPSNGTTSIPVRFFPRWSPTSHAVREYAVSNHFVRWFWHHASDYDLIHIHAIFSFLPTAAMAIARLQQVPYVVRPLGQLCHWSLQQGALKKWLYLNAIEYANLQASQMLHFTSLQEQHEASQLGLTTPSFVLPHGLTMPQQQPDASLQLRQRLNLSSTDPIILFLSRLHPKKGLEVLIQALQSVAQYPFQFVIAGNGGPEYEAAIDRQLAESGLSLRTHRIGFVDGELKALLLQGADLFALTSYSENFGIAALEALAAGQPLLLSDGVALSSLVQQQQLGWVTSCEVRSVAQALEQFLQCPSAAKNMGDRARHVVQQQFAWEHIAATLVQHYNTLSSTTTTLDTHYAISHYPSYPHL